MVVQTVKGLSRVTDLKLQLSVCWYAYVCMCVVCMFVYTCLLHVCVCMHMRVCRCVWLHYYACVCSKFVTVTAVILTSAMQAAVIFLNCLGGNVIYSFSNYITSLCMHYYKQLLESKLICVLISKTRYYKWTV